MTTSRLAFAIVVHAPRAFAFRTSRPQTDNRLSVGLCYVRYGIDCLVTGTDKPLVWLSGEIKTPPFSASARLEAGVVLRRLQSGELLRLPHSRPMPSIGRHFHELRIGDENGAWRIMYRIDPDAVVLLAVFRKTTRATPRRVIAECKRRLGSYDRAIEGR